MNIFPNAVKLYSDFQVLQRELKVNFLDYFNTKVQLSNVLDMMGKTRDALSLIEEALSINPSIQGLIKNKRKLLLKLEGS